LLVREQGERGEANCISMGAKGFGHMFLALRLRQAKPCRESIFFFKSLNSQIKSQYGVEIIGKILFPGSRGNVSRDTLCQLLSAAAILRGPQVPGYSSPGWEGTDCKSS